MVGGDLLSVTYDSFCLRGMMSIVRVFVLFGFFLCFDNIYFTFLLLLRKKIEMGNKKEIN